MKLLIEAVNWSVICVTCDTNSPEGHKTPKVKIQVTTGNSHLYNDQLSYDSTAWSTEVAM